ncbi:MAG TPA: NADH-ubiquinone oxidoreductase-F iron-sulfur binding region domain-containing protein [Polyangiaceae bacterium]|nr:NADH-ubiquinone oxidoreductase-F iron-sulfur binding region domain-containing protein [Polyangiaceae bacterium]
MRLLPDKPWSSYRDYLAAVGEDAVDKARALPPTEVLQKVQHAGLRGRGGAGFPTGTKWATLANHPCPTRQVVCNAAEGEPATFKDRWLIRHNPYAVLEGMLIAAHVIGAERLFIALKSSFTQESARLRAAAEELSLNDIEIVEGPEEYLFGEERALLEVIEGGEPLPREPHYPPFEKGAFSTPRAPTVALVNNAQTFAHVPSIVRSGAAAFRKLGTSDTPGTLIFTVCGDVVRPGVYECEAGITLRELFYEIAGGPRPGRRFKAALPGVSAAVIMPNRFDTRADFGSMHMAGSALGSCGFWLLDDSAGMSRVLQSVARFLYVESCNQCSACKHGLRTASSAIDEIFDEATASEDDIPRALYGARSAPQGNRCYLPVGGAILIPSLIENFADELAGPHGEPILLPKIVDFSEEGFRYDELTPLKTPDWTYLEPPLPVAPPPARPAERPHDADHAPVVVRLAPDVAAAFEDSAIVAGRPLDQVVNEALREWLRRRDRLAR